MKKTVTCELQIYHYIYNGETKVQFLVYKSKQTHIQISHKNAYMDSSGGGGGDGDIVDDGDNNIYSLCL